MAQLFKSGAYSVQTDPSERQPGRTRHKHQNPLEDGYNVPRRKRGQDGGSGQKSMLAELVCRLDRQFFLVFGQSLIKIIE